MGSPIHPTPRRAEGDLRGFIGPNDPIVVTEVGAEWASRRAFPNLGGFVNPTRLMSNSQRWGRFVKSRTYGFRQGGRGILEKEEDLNADSAESGK